MCSSLLPQQASLKSLTGMYRGLPKFRVLRCAAVLSYIFHIKPGSLPDMHVTAPTGFTEKGKICPCPGRARLSLLKMLPCDLSEALRHGHVLHCPPELSLCGSFASAQAQKITALCKDMSQGTQDCALCCQHDIGRHLCNLHPQRH